MDLNMVLKQTQTLTPQMIQFMEFLQMGTMELREYLQGQLQENPVLEMDEPMSSPSSRQGGGQDQLLQKLEWLHSTDVQNSWYNREDARDLIELVPGADSGAESLYDHLCAQIHFKDLPPSVAVAAECVLQSLDFAGRLDESPEALASRTGISAAVIREAVRLVQSLEPAGVAARDLSECLCLQLVRRGENGLALTIARRHLEDMGQNHYNRIAQLTGASREAVRAACRLIRSLDPRPGAAYAPRENPGYIIPDLAVAAVGDRFEVVLNDSYTPVLRVSSYYHRMMEATDDAEVRSYLSAKVRQAEWVVQNMEQRRVTLLSCTRCIVSHQEDFFRRGPGHLRPLSMANTAEELGIHGSTVSRAVRGKYLQCAHGVFPLKYFFSRSLPAPAGEGEVSADRARSALRALIDNEDKKKPLSDQRLSELLAAQGTRLSRRTVAKYRDELGIPSAAGRKDA